MIREVTAKSRTWSPPLKNAQSFANHSLDRQEADDGWSIRMGSDNDLKGGQVSPEVLKLIQLLGAL